MSVREIDSGDATGGHTVGEEERPASPLAIALFGAFDVRLEGRPLPRLRSQKSQWLLALLALQGGRSVERAWLAGTLWPDSTEHQAAFNLSRNLTDLRQSLGPEARRLDVPTPHTLRLDLVGAEADVLRFDEAIARGGTASLEQAVALHQGPLLQGCEEEWVLQEREPREQAYHAALETLAAHAMAREAHAEAVRYLRRLVVAEPLRDSAQRALMQALAAAGDVAAATQVYRDFRLLLHQELNADPDPDTIALYQQIRAGARQRLAQPRRPTTDDRPPTTDDRPPTTDEQVLTHHASRITYPESSVGGRFPQGTVTFLMTDIEGSTRLWEQDPEAMREALARHDALCAGELEKHGGVLVKSRGEGDSLFAVFPAASDAVAAACALQRQILAKTWPVPLRVRIALHSGEADFREGDYSGPVVNRCARLRAIGHGGQTLLSGATAEQVYGSLPEGVTLRDLGRHRLRDLEQPEHLFQLDHPDLPAEFPPLRSLEAFTHNLPRPLTPLVGRETEVREVRARLTDGPLVTLTGPGGIGKTRLAIQVAEERRGESAEGVCFVELAGLSQDALVPLAVAAALGVREQPGQTLTETLQEALAPRQLLLVLDNCEHLVEACAPLAEALLTAAPGLRILATSRQLLGLTGEVVWPVPPLSLPEPRQGSRVEGQGSRVEGRGSRVKGQGSRVDDEPFDPRPSTLFQSEAVRLFIERATAAVPTFGLTEGNAAVVAQLCRRLDGIPLAIELAAARVRVLPVEQIVARLDDSLRLLTGGGRTAPPRHQTLRATLDWSHALLSEPERALLRRLSVFAGGFTLEAAEGVCADGGAGSRQQAAGSEEPSGLPAARCLLPAGVLDLLMSLIDKSLVEVDAQAGEGRYRMLETVRQYARDRLLEGGEAEAVRARHCDFFVSFAERAEPVVGEQQGAWLERLESDVDNLRAALEWGLASQPEAALRMAAALGPFWELHGYFAEGRAFLERGLERAPEAPGEVRAKALGWAGHLALRQGDWERAKELLEGSLELSRTVGDRRGIASSLLCLGQLAEYQGDRDAAWDSIEESLAICREIGDQWGTANALSKLANVALNRSDREAARPLCVECLAIHRELGNRRGIADALLNLGWMAIEEGDYPAGQSLYAESLAIYREIGDKPGVFWALNGLGWAAELQGDYEAARGFFEERLRIAREVGSRRFVALSLWRLGDVAWARGEYEAARERYEESRALGRQMGNQWLVSNVLDGLGNVASAQGEYAEARACFEESLRIWREAGWEPRMAASLEGLAKIAAAEGEAARAARLLGAAEGLCAATDVRLSPAERADYERTVHAARSQLDAEAFAAAWAEGQGMTLEHAVAYALER